MSVSVFVFEGGEREREREACCVVAKRGLALANAHSTGGLTQGRRFPHASRITANPEPPSNTNSNTLTLTLTRALWLRPPPAVARHRDRDMQVAVDGQRLANCALFVIGAGAVARSTAAKPRRAKYGAAVVVSRKSRARPRSFARAMSRS